jgi:hypothetical protein
LAESQRHRKLLTAASLANELDSAGEAMSPVAVSNSSPVDQLADPSPQDLGADALGLAAEVTPTPEPMVPTELVAKFENQPEYSTSYSEHEWDYFRSPFGPPQFPPEIAERISLYEPGMGRQRPATETDSTAGGQFDLWSTMAKSSLHSLLGSTAWPVDRHWDEVGALARDKEYQERRTPPTSKLRDAFLAHELGSPPIYIYKTKSGYELPFIWPLDAVALLLKFFREDILLDYHPDQLREAISEDWHSWDWYLTWWQSGHPTPGTFNQLMLKLFLDELKTTGLQKSRKHFDVALTLGGFPARLADDRTRKLTLMSVPRSVPITEITEAILVPALKLLESTTLMFEGKPCIGTAEFIGDSQTLADLACMKVNTSDYSAVRPLSLL